MGTANRFIAGGLSGIFAAVTIGLGYGTEQCIVRAFHEAASKYHSTGNVVLDCAGALFVAGLTLMAATGAVWMAGQAFGGRDPDWN